MPIEPNPQTVMAWPHQANVPVPVPQGASSAGMFVTVQVQTDGTATVEALDATLQSLIDHLQTWPGRDPQADVMGQKYDTSLYTVTPTDPIDPPDPPDPEPETP